MRRFDQIPIPVLMLATFALIAAAVAILHPWSNVGVNP
jgi:hypothetical protein